MKTKFYYLIVIFSSFFGIVNAQTQANTPDLIALPTTYNSTTCSLTSNSFPFSVTYNPNASVQLGVNNTGTDISQNGSTTPARIFQAMVWDNVITYTNPTNFTSNVYLSCNYNGIPVFSYTFPGGFDPDVAIFTDSSGTYVQVVFENNTSGKIDGYTFRWNILTSTFVLHNLYKSTLSHDATKKAKNPNIAAAKSAAGFAVVWHEEGLVNPPQTLSITYSTVPPTTYTNTISILESKVYIYASDKIGYLGDLLGSPTTTTINALGDEVIRTAPSNSYHLFDRNFNPDVSISEDVYNSSVSNQRGISVVFLSEWFDPSTFSIVTGQLSVVQGARDRFLVNPSYPTITYNYTTSYTGKPRIAARLPFSGVNVSKDFSVVMGNFSTVLPPCGGTNTLSSKIHNWWFQTGGLTICPTGGVNLLTGTAYASSTAVNPVVSCINGKGFYNVTFSAVNTLANGFDVVASTFKEGLFANTSNIFSLVNQGQCGVANTVGNQIVPSVASIMTAGTPSGNNAVSNYLFWDQQSKTLDFKKVTTNTLPGTGLGLRLSHNTTKEFKAYPNPTSNELVFDYNLDENEIPLEIEIFNMMGQSVDKFLISETSTKQKRDVNKIPSGTYIAILKTNAENYKFEFVKK